MPRTAFRHDDGPAAAWLRDVGARLSWVREIRADSQTHAARLLGVDQSTWSQYESGQRLVPVRVAIAACREWGLSLDFLYRGVIGGSLARELEVQLVARHPELVDPALARKPTAQAPG